MAPKAMPASTPTSPGMQELSRFLVWPSEECRLALEQARAALLAPNGQTWPEVAHRHEAIMDQQAATIERLQRLLHVHHDLMYQVVHHRELLAAARGPLQSAVTHAVCAGMETRNPNAIDAAVDVAMAMRTLYGDDEVMRRTMRALRDDDVVEVEDVDPEDVVADGEEEEDEDVDPEDVVADGDEEEAGEERHYHRI